MTCVYLHLPTLRREQSASCFFCPYPYMIFNNCFNNVFHSVLVVWQTASDTATSRQYRRQCWSLTRTVYVQAWLSVVVPTCPTSPTASSQGMRQRRCSTCTTCGRGLPDVQQPQQQQQPQRRRHCAGRQVREAHERWEREREERINRRSAATEQPPTDDDLSLPAPAEPTPPPSSPRKVARVAPFVPEQFPVNGPMGRGQMLHSMLNAPGLVPPPSNWDHGDGRPVGDLQPSELQANPLAVFVRRRTGKYSKIHLPTGQRIMDCRLIARVKPFSQHIEIQNNWGDNWG